MYRRKCSSSTGRLTVLEGTGIEDGGAGSGILERGTGDRRVEVAMVEGRSLFEKYGRF
jgi:hypothetical protein